MAKLSAHGIEIGRIRYVTFVVAYFADGTILRDSGLGWKTYRRVKPGIDPRQVFERKRLAYADRLAQNPHLAAYRKALHDLAGNNKAWKLHACVELMPDDPDGVWSDACDGFGDNVRADISEIVELCDLYHLAMREMEESKAAA